MASKFSLTSVCVHLTQHFLLICTVLTNTLRFMLSTWVRLRPVLHLAVSPCGETTRRLSRVSSAMSHYAVKTLSLVSLPPAAMLSKLQVICALEADGQCPYVEQIGFTLFTLRGKLAKSLKIFMKI